MVYPVALTEQSKDWCGCFASLHLNSPPSLPRGQARKCAVILIVLLPFWAMQFFACSTTHLSCHSSSLVCVPCCFNCLQSEQGLGVAILPASQCPPSSTLSPGRAGLFECTTIFSKGCSASCAQPHPAHSGPDSPACMPHCFNCLPLEHGLGGAALHACFSVPTSSAVSLAHIQQDSAHFTWGSPEYG